MNTADNLLITPQDMHQRDFDYFERKGCYDLALAILLDCLQQLAHDSKRSLQATQMEYEWLIGRSTHAPVSCQQVLATLGMEPGGRLQQQFQRIAVDDPALAIRMLTSRQARDAFRTVCAVAAPDEENPQVGRDCDTPTPDKASGKASAWTAVAFEPWAAAVSASGEEPPAAARVEALDALHATLATHASDSAALAGADLVRHLVQDERFPVEGTAAQLPSHDAAQGHCNCEEEDSTHVRSDWRMRLA